MKKSLLFTILFTLTLNAQTITDYVKVSGNPTGIVFDEQGTLYIGGESDYSIRKYYLNGPLTTLRSNMDGQPRQISLANDGQLYGAFQALGSIKTLNPLTGDGKMFPTTNPFGIGQNPINKMIYYTKSTTNGSIEAYDINTSVGKTIATNIINPAGIVFDSKGNTYVSSNTKPGAIYKIDINDNKVTTVVSNINYPAYLALDGNNLYISTESSGKIYKYDINENNEQAELIVSGLDYTNGLAVYDGNLYCAIVSENKIIKISFNLNTQEIKNTNQISIYPNPAENFIHIKGFDKVEKIELFSINGELLLINTNNNSLDISSLKKGVYLIKVKTKNTMFHQKIIKK